MRYFLLVLTGFIPLPIGFGLHYVLTTYDLGSPLFYDSFNAVFLILWFMLGFILYGLTKEKIMTNLIVHIPACIALILAFIQDIILKRYWSNIIGYSTQFYFFPTLRFSYNLKTGPTVFSSMFVSVITMILVFFLGSLLREYLKNKRNAVVISKTVIDPAK